MTIIVVIRSWLIGLGVLGPADGVALFLVRILTVLNAMNHVHVLGRIGVDLRLLEGLKLPWHVVSVTILLEILVFADGGCDILLVLFRRPVFGSLSTVFPDELLSGPLFFFHLFD